MKIFKGVKKPDSQSGARVKYPFGKMKPGDMFHYKCKDSEIPKTIQASICSTAKQRGFKISTQVVGSVIRVWLDGEIDAKK